MKSKHANWEAEGEVGERIGKALAEGEQWRLANVARGDKGKRIPEHLLGVLVATLVCLTFRARSVLSLRRGLPNDAQAPGGSSWVRCVEKRSGS